MSERKRKTTDRPDPAPVLDLIEAFRRSKTMFAAVALGVFDQLAQEEADAAPLARKMQVSPEALERLLDACVGLSLLRKKKSKYAILPIARTYLCRSSPQTLAGYILYSNKALYALWGNLEGAVREGKHRWRETFGFEGPIFDHFYKTEESKRGLLTGMHGFGLLSSPAVTVAFDLSRFRRLVDLGGATGHLAVAACKHYPQLRAVVFDLPAAIEVAREFIAPSPYADRIELIAGDFFSDPLPKADLFSLGRILHDWSEEKVRGLLARIYAALPRGGALLIAEKLLDETKTGPLPALMQSLNMLVCTEGKERTLSEYAALLRQAGFEQVQGHKTGAPLDAVMAIKKK